jgi:DNA end-binding protein Ku
MAARSLWKGSISFGLVNIPVKLYASADTSKDFSFNQLDNKGHRIQQRNSIFRSQERLQDIKG